MRQYRSTHCLVPRITIYGAARGVMGGSTGNRAEIRHAALDLAATCSIEKIHKR
jgi:hypothetical protein